MDLYFIRHGESTGNRDSRVQSAATELTAQGLEQAALTGRWLAQYFATAGRPPVALYSSDLRRAWQTATIIGRYLGLDPQPEPGLREKYAGAAEDHTYREMAARYPELLKRWQDYTDLEWGWPGGETRREMQDRTNAALAALAARHRLGDTLVIVTHGGPLWAYLSSQVPETPASLTESNAHLANCGITHVHLPNGPGDVLGAACLRTLNQVAHLGDITTGGAPS